METSSSSAFRAMLAEFNQLSAEQQQAERE